MNHGPYHPLPSLQEAAFPKLVPQCGQLRLPSFGSCLASLFRTVMKTNSTLPSMKRQMCWLFVDDLLDFLTIWFFGMLFFRQGLCQFHVVHFRCSADQPVRSCCFQIEKSFARNSWFPRQMHQLTCMDVMVLNGIWRTGNGQQTCRLESLLNETSRLQESLRCIRTSSIVDFVCFEVMVHQILRSWSVRFASSKRLAQQLVCFHFFHWTSHFNANFTGSLGERCDWLNLQDWLVDIGWY